jgi:hypothetical protein
MVRSKLLMITEAQKAKFYEHIDAVEMGDKHGFFGMTYEQGLRDMMEAMDDESAMNDLVASLDDSP